MEVYVPGSYKRVPTKHFSYVNCGTEIILSGGQFTDDQTCSIDSYRIEVQTGILKDMNACLKQARMQHSMVLIAEKGVILAVGGEDENGNLLDSCEIYNT